MIAPGRGPDTQRRETATAGAGRELRTPVAWGVVWGCLQAASPVALPWLDPAAVYALGLVLIASVYIGLSVADGRGRVTAAETGVASVAVAVAVVADSHLGW